MRASRTIALVCGALATAILVLTAYRIRGRVYVTAEVRGYFGFRTIDSNAANGIDDVKNRGLTFLVGLRWANEPQPPQRRRAARDQAAKPVDTCETSTSIDEAHQCPGEKRVPDAE